LSYTITINILRPEWNSVYPFNLFNNWYFYTFWITQSILQNLFFSLWEKYCILILCCNKVYWR
jgi:hypothetical protein